MASFFPTSYISKCPRQKRTSRSFIPTNVVAANVVQSYGTQRSREKVQKWQQIKVTERFIERLYYDRCSKLRPQSQKLTNIRVMRSSTKRASRTPNSLRDPRSPCMAGAVTLQASELGHHDLSIAVLRLR
ncbi:hypothetical protein TNCV_198141 [Trichonephila clavipes]|nr:hypothetical protein TNCV_198141 [Trichonephila clavipes]